MVNGALSLRILPQLRAINRIILTRWLRRPTEPLLVTTTVALQLVLILLTVGFGIGMEPDTKGWHSIVKAELVIGSILTIYGAYATATGRTRQIAVFRALGARRSLVLKLLAWEMGLLAVGGIFAGIGFSLTTEILVNRYMRARLIAIPLRWLGYMIGLGVIGPSIGAVYGASTAMRGSISSALLHK